MQKIIDNTKHYLSTNFYNVDDFIRECLNYYYNNPHTFSFGKKILESYDKQIDDLKKNLWFLQ